MQKQIAAGSQGSAEMGIIMETRYGQEPRGNEEKRFFYKRAALQEQDKEAE